MKKRETERDAGVANRRFLEPAALSPVGKGRMGKVGASRGEGLLHPSVVSFPSPGCRDRRWQAQLAQQSEIFGDFNRRDEWSRPYFAFHALRRLESMLFRDDYACR